MAYRISVVNSTEGKVTRVLYCSNYSYTGATAEEVVTRFPALFTPVPVVTTRGANMGRVLRALVPGLVDT